MTTKQDVWIAWRLKGHRALNGKQQEFRYDFTINTSSLDPRSSSLPIS